MLAHAGADQRLDAVVCLVVGDLRLLLPLYGPVVPIDNREDHEVPAAWTGAAQDGEAACRRLQDEIAVCRELRVVVLADLPVRKGIVTLSGHGCSSAIVMDRCGGRTSTRSVWRSTRRGDAGRRGGAP